MDAELIIQTPSARIDASQILESVTFSDNINKCGNLEFSLPIPITLSIWYDKKNTL